MLRRLAPLAFLLVVPLLGGCCCGCGYPRMCGYRLFHRPCVFGNCGGCGEVGCASCAGGYSAGYPATGAPAMGPVNSAPPPAAMPSQPIPQLSSVPTANTVPTRIIR